MQPEKTVHQKQTVNKSGGCELLEELRLLWEALNSRHAEVSPYFKAYFENHSFEKRKSSLIEKSHHSGLKVFLALQQNSHVPVGYCIGSISTDRVGEIDSIFVEEPFRGTGVADDLMTEALDWFEESGVTDQTICVVTGNERAYGFYERYGFFPKYTELFRTPAHKP